MTARHAANLAPRLLKQQEAATYCGMSVETFKRRVPVPPIVFGAGHRLWDRFALDRWIDSLDDSRPILDLAAEWDRAKSAEEYDRAY